MDAVVLAGGYATRLWPVTRHRPKMLLPVGSTTVVDRVLAALEADDRVGDVYVSTNERFADAFAAHLADTTFEKPQLSVEETVAEDEKFGVVGALAQLVDREALGTDDLLVVAGDNVLGFDLSRFLDFFDAGGTTALAAHDVGSRAQARQYGLVDLDGDRVVDFQEKPDEPPSTLVSIACYAFRAADIRFAEYLAGDNNPDEPGWFLQWLQARSSVRAFSFDEAWFDIGTPENYLAAVAWALEGDTRVAETATVENTTLGANVHMMDGATVRDATLERAVVFPDATVEDATLRSSLVDHDALVRGIDSTGALIGAHSRLP
jgi:Nucleoside-diphosphate-sugar pyrophosphorylase involved in lipopolysaccharide biosynthesis/translation initiation factor 2B, gamma/epsilon subunits (eIF-2Bgamma/eIF-2Bepsilon)